MFIKDIPLLKNVFISPFQSAEEASDLMAKHHSWDVPVVDGQTFIGIVNEGILISEFKSPFIRDLKSKFTIKSVKTEDHLLFAYRTMLQSGIFMMPVLNDDNQFVGTLSRLVLFENFGKVFGFFEPGSLIVIRVLKRDFSLSRVCHLIESEGGSVLSSFVSSDSDSDFLNLSLRLQTVEINDVVSTLKRHEYDVLSFYNEDQLKGLLDDRYDQLINYLNI